MPRGGEIKGPGIDSAICHAVIKFMTILLTFSSSKELFGQALYLIWSGFHNSSRDKWDHWVQVKLKLI